MSILKIRQSQIVSTYGPGALVDLPDRAVLVAGLGHWIGEGQPVFEPRLLAHLRERRGMSVTGFRAPPVPEREDDVSRGIVAWQFPEWNVAQFEVVSAKFGRSRPLVNRRSLTNGRYTGEDPSGKRKRKEWPVVPVRFVQACPNGHVSDIDWPRLIHGPGVTCTGQLWLDERGTTGDLAELYLRCDGCGSEPVCLVQLQGTITSGSALGDCKGERPWLGAMAGETCQGPEGKPHRNKLLIRHASHAYFPVRERAISIPDHDEKLRKAVDSVWEDYLSVAEAEGDVRRERKKARVAQALEGFSDADVWQECQRRNSGSPAPSRDLKDVELDTFLSVPDELGEDKLEGDFHARRLTPPAEKKGAMRFVEGVVLAHRLREVEAQIGFTRFEAPGQAVRSDMDLGVRVAPLALDTPWLPAVENRGEGVFLALDAARVKKWADGTAVERKAKAFEPGISGLSKTPVPLQTIRELYMPYVMLHSLAHLLLTAISLECGYAAASIRERIYVRNGGYGLLLYTGTPDAEGTLGGLVQVGRHIEKHLEAALELGRLCSSDPVCAQHRPDQTHNDRRLHGAACHGCLLIAEPSCEMRNELLDRSLVVPTVDQSDCAFFDEST